MARIFFSFLIVAFAFVASPFGGPAGAQDRTTPYWASIDSEKVNMRVGPSRDYPIDWVYKRKGLPVKVIRLREGWRLIEDPNGDQGWVVSSLLSANRTALIIGEGPVDLRAGASASSALRWKAQPGNVGALGKCEAGWCELDIAGRTGWVLRERLWGPGEP